MMFVLPTSIEKFIGDQSGIRSIFIVAFICSMLHIPSIISFPLAASILPAIMVLIGIFSIWVSKEIVMKYLGRHSGWKGGALAILFGARPTEPLYVVYPIAAALKSKGASVSNVIVFLTA